MKLRDLLTNATPQADRWKLFGRTAADDLRDLGYPVDQPASGGGRSAVADEEEEEETNEAEVPNPDDADDAQEKDDAEKEELEQVVKDESEEKVEGDEDDESDPNYKKRFVGSQKAYLELKRDHDALQQQIHEQNQRLATVEARANRVPDTSPKVREETVNRLTRELDGIDATDKDARAKVIQKWVGTIDEVAKQEGEAAARRVVQESQANAQGKEQAVSLMKDALKRKGLDPEKFFSWADAKAAHLKATNMQWFTQTPIKDQFDALADLVVADVQMVRGDATRKANEQHRKGAEGTLDQSRKTIKKPSSTDKEDVPDRGFSKQVRDVQRQRIAEGQKRAQMAGLR